MPNQSNKNHLGFGCGYRPHYFSDLRDSSLSQSVEWLEATTENFLGLGEQIPKNRPLQRLLQLRADREIVLHGVTLSIGSADPVDTDYLKRVKTLCEIVKPVFISDHLCWSSVGGEVLHDLLPLPYTVETVKIVSENLQKVQEFLGFPIAIENVSSYAEFKHSEMTEWEFINEVLRKSGSQMLLDINNVYVSSFNHGFDPKKYIDSIPKELVVQYHLAGHSNNGTHLIDTHDAPICKEVWDLYEYTLTKIGSKSTLIERDDHFPEFSELLAEVTKAKGLAVHGPKDASASL